MKYTMVRVYSINVTKELLEELNENYFQYDDCEVSTDPDNLTAEEKELVESALDEFCEELINTSCEVSSELLA